MGASRHPQNARRENESAYVAHGQGDGEAQAAKDRGAWKREISRRLRTGNFRLAAPDECEWGSRSKDRYQIHLRVSDGNKFIHAERWRPRILCCAIYMVCFSPGGDIELAGRAKGREPSGGSRILGCRDHGEI